MKKKSRLVVVGVLAMGMAVTLACATPMRPDRRANSSPRHVRSKPNGTPNPASSGRFAPVPQPQSSSRGRARPEVASFSSGRTNCRKPRYQKCTCSAR